MSDFPKTTDEILTRLEEGNARYVADKLERKHQDQARRDALEGVPQPPWCIVLSCADSRVTPELIFDTGIGELFVVRVAGNVANVETIASIEYAVANIPESKVIVVLGHENCGAVTAAMKDADNGLHLNALLAQIQPAKHACGGPDAPVNDVVKKNAELVAQDLIDRSPIIREAMDAGKKGLVIKHGYYELVTGKVTIR